MFFKWCSCQRISRFHKNIGILLRWIYNFDSMSIFQPINSKNILGREIYNNTITSIDVYKIKQDKANGRKLDKWYVDYLE